MGNKYVKEDETFNTSRNGVVPKPTAQEISDGKVLGANGTWVASGGGGGSVNDAYKSVKVGLTTITASGEDTLEFEAGSNITLTPDALNKKITIQASGGGGGGGNVTGVKGNAESTYRTGDVNLTPQNLGLGTAAVKDVPESGNASDTEVVMGSDTRLGNLMANTNVLKTDRVPYLERQVLSVPSASHYIREKLVGGSFCWNQLVDTGTSSVTIANGRKYAFYHAGAWSVGQSNGSAISTSSGDKFTDITMMFGSTIANYIYGLGSANAVTFLNSMGFFTQTDYEYNAGSVQSPKCSAHVLLKTEPISFQFGSRNASSGAIITNNNRLIPTDFLILKAGIIYKIYVSTTASKTVRASYSFWSNRDSSGNPRIYDSGWIENFPIVIKPTTDSNVVITVSYTDNSAITLSDVSATIPNILITYSYPNIALNGNTVLNDNEVNYDGDELASNGEITRNYAKLTNKTGSVGGTIALTGAVSNLTDIVTSKGHLEDIGTISGTTLTLTKALSNDTIVYKLATPTKETSTSFTDPMSINGAESEQLVDARSLPIPVGHKTEYLGKSSDAVDVPPSPTSDGKWGLHCYVADGKPNYVWELEE